MGREEMRDMFRSWNLPRSSSLDDYFSTTKGVPYSRVYTGIGLGLKTGLYRGSFIVSFFLNYSNSRFKLMVVTKSKMKSWDLSIEYLSTYIKVTEFLKKLGIYLDIVL